MSEHDGNRPMTVLELTDARTSVSRALNDLLIAEAKLNSLAAQLDLALLRHPDHPIHDEGANRNE